MLKRSAFGLLAATLILAGCGGGGSSSAPSYSGPTGTVSVTNTTEGNTAAGFVATEALSSGFLDTTNVYTPAFSASTNSTNPPNLRAFSTLAKKYADMAFKLNPPNLNVPAGTSYSSSQPCDSGNITGSVVYQNTYPEAGSSITFTFNSCVLLGVKLTGSLKLNINSYTAGGSAFTASYSFNRLTTTIVSSGDYAMMHGGFTASITDDGSLFSSSVTGTSMYSKTSVSGTVNEAQLSNFSYVDTYDYGGTGAVTLDHDFTIASTNIGGSVTVNTVTAFSIPSGSSYPTSGQIIVTGASNAKVRLTAQADGVNVYVEYDLNGDDIYESNATVTWASL